MISEDFFFDAIETIFKEIEVLIRKSIDVNYGLDYHVFNSCSLYKVKERSEDFFDIERLQKYYTEHLKSKILVNQQTSTDHEGYSIQESLFNSSFLNLPQTAFLTQEEPEQPYYIYNDGEINSLKYIFEKEILDPQYSNSDLKSYHSLFEFKLEKYDLSIITADILELLNRTYEGINYNGFWEDSESFQFISPNRLNWQNPIGDFLYRTLYHRFAILFDNFEIVVRNIINGDSYISEQTTLLDNDNITSLYDLISFFENAKYQLRPEEGDSITHKTIVVIGCKLSIKITSLMLDAFIFLLMYRLPLLQYGAFTTVNKYKQKIYSSSFIKMEDYQFLTKIGNRDYITFSKYNRETIAYLFWLIREEETLISDLSQTKYLKLIKALTGYSDKQFKKIFQKINKTTNSKVLEKDLKLLVNLLEKIRKHVGYL